MILLMAELTFDDDFLSLVNWEGLDHAGVIHL
jgi:hypothetical protein